VTEGEFNNPLLTIVNFLQNRLYLRTLAGVSKCKKVEITPCILSGHNGIKLELNSTRNYRKYSNY
jgi:hypothetical protein